jgi:hypothetical protein
MALQTTSLMHALYFCRVSFSERENKKTIKNYSQIRCKFQAGSWWQVANMQLMQNEHL